MREITIPFKGITYTISAKRAFEVGEEVEEIITLADIAAWQQRPKMHKMARAVGHMLRFAGAKVSNEEVLESMTGGDDPALGQANAAAAMASLINVLTGGAQGDGGDDVPEKITAS